MTHQQRGVSGYKSKEKTSGGGKSKSNNFLSLSLPGEFSWMLVPRYIPVTIQDLDCSESSSNTEGYLRILPRLKDTTLRRSSADSPAKLLGGILSLLPLTSDFAGQSSLQDRGTGPGCCPRTGGGGGGSGWLETLMIIVIIISVRGLWN